VQRTEAALAQSPLSLFDCRHQANIIRDELSERASVLMSSGLSDASSVVTHAK
jgi:hypothetical protein